jgi:hypothetical protein
VKIHNVHEREVDGSVAEVTELLDVVALWPTEITPAPRAEGDDALRVGPMLWRKVDREGAALAFRVEQPVELQADHWFDATRRNGGTTLRHTIDGRADGAAKAVWQQIEPIHDRVMEAFLDRIEMELV